MDKGLAEDGLVLEGKIESSLQTMGYGNKSWLWQIADVIAEERER